MHKIMLNRLQNLINGNDRPVPNETPREEMEVRKASAERKTQNREQTTAAESSIDRRGTQQLIRTLAECDR
uniref:Uncharacterized protein n=1 Tax=Romanomermis culicivorax TaxID=13658 RepID=A0A915JZY1_ROMCU